MKALLILFSVTVVSFALAGEGAAEAQPSQQASSSSTAIDDKARELFLEGVKAAEKSQWAKAHAAFLAAWSLKAHYQIAGNLGTAEAKLGKWRDAAEHLSLYLREAPKEKVAERKSAEELLAQARSKVGALTVRVEPAGAEVFVDGKVVGKAPLAGEVFVEPGARVLEAKLAGYEAAKHDVSAGAGAAQVVEMRLAPPGAKGSGELRKLSASPEERTGEAALKPKGAAQGEVAKMPPAAKEEPRGPSKAVIIAGAATSAVMVGAGVVFAVVSTNRGADADERLAAVRRRGNATSCSDQAVAADCAEIHAALSARDTFGELSFWSFVTGGALGAATVAYALTAPWSASSNAVRAVPVVAWHGAGVVVVGAW